MPGLSNLTASRFRTELFHQMTVDTMLVDKHSLVFLNAEDLREVDPCDVTGHFPILAGYNERTGRELYVAVVRGPHWDLDPWYFTCVEEGAWAAKYFDEVGEEQTERDFFVLALRHDPVDLPPPYPRARKGAMDPTGPVFWLSFWPRKDPEYFEEARLEKDDRALESILDGFVEEKRFLSGFD